MKYAGMKKLVVIMLVALSMVSTVWARGAYKWIDDQGVVHYSDRLRGDPASIINIPVKEPETVPAAEDPQAVTDKSKPETAPETVHQLTPVEKKIRQENCIKARGQLETNQRLTRMYRVVDGERHYLSETERDDVIKRSREAVSYWCD